MILDACASPSVLKVMRIIKIVITAIKIIVPILLLVTGAMTFLKAVADGDNKKASQAFIRKCIAAIAIFMVPTIVGMVFKLLDQDKLYYSCLENATKEGIITAQAQLAEYYMVNAKSTLTESSYRAAKSIVEDMYDSPEKTKLLTELEQVKKDTEAAIKERQEKYKKANMSTGISSSGDYTAVEAMDMQESVVKAMNHQECMDYVASMARDIYFKNGGVLPSITVAQAVLETGYCQKFESGSYNLYGLIGYPPNKDKVNRTKKFDN